MDPVFEFPIRLPPRDSRSLLRSLHAQLRAALLDGRLKPGARLPSTRKLAQAYGISRNTAVAAIELLASEGYVVTRQGSGAYVADALPRRPVRRSAASRRPDRRLHALWRTPPLAPEIEPDTALRHVFRLGVPDVAEFPFDVWRRLSARALRALARQPAAYAARQGQAALREAIARHVSFARAVACGPDDVLVTGGAQQAFDLIARTLVTPGRTVVAIENPGYPPMRAAFAAAGAKIASVRVDADGIVVERIPPAARVICVTPSHQFPTGTAMSAARRAALLDRARTQGAVVIEDDYDGEFRFGGRPLDALQTLDRNESVFYVGTFSKCLFPAIRLGYVVAPPWAQRALVAAKHCADWHSGVIEQETLAAFIAEGHLARHVRRMRAVYAQRRTAVLAAIERDFSRWLEPVPNVAGLHLTAFSRPRVDADALIERARAASVGIGSLRAYYLGAARGGLVFGYGAIGERDIVDAFARLRRVLPR